jgi:hypothetical protein
VQPAKRDVRAAPPIVIGQPVRAIRRRYVDLDDDEIGLVVESQALDVLVLDLDLLVFVKVGGKRRQAERREERILDGAPERARRLRQRRQDHLDLHRRPSPAMKIET